MIQIESKKAWDNLDDILAVMAPVVTQNSTTLHVQIPAGLPLIRAMWLHYPDDDEAVTRGDQYLWGRDILVAPIVERAAAWR